MTKWDWRKTWPKTKSGSKKETSFIPGLILGKLRPNGIGEWAAVAVHFLALVRAVAGQCLKRDMLGALNTRPRSLAHLASVFSEID
jgi:hypothetical protein